MVTTHFIGLLFLIMLFFPIFNFILATAFIRCLGIPPVIAFLLIVASLFGSMINIGFMEFTSEEPIVVFDEITFFGFRWLLPKVIHRHKVILAINVGGAIIPILVSLILLLYIVPNYELNPIITYIKILCGVVIVTIVVNKFSLVKKGLGILVPLFIPVTVTVITTLVLYGIYVISNPFIIAYVSGTFGTLIGADILNLKKVLKGYAYIVSIGGAGTFDGIFMTGLISILMVFLLIL